MRSRRILLAFVLGVVTAFVLATLVFGCGHYGEPKDLFPSK